MKEIFTTEIFKYDLDGKLLDPPHKFQRFLCTDFTEEEKEHLSLVLAGYGEQKIIEFINRIEPICGDKYDSINFNDVYEAKENSINLIGKLEAACHEIDLVVLKENILIPYQTVRRFDYSISNGDISMEYENSDLSLLEKDIIGKCSSVQGELLEILGKLHKLREISSKTGRKTVNNDGFYSQLAKLYSLIIDKPTTTRSGKFAECTGIINKAVGLPGECPERAIKQAVKELKAT